jgi:hypothetical protein
MRNAVFLSVATFAAGLLVPSIPYVGLPLAAFALGWMTFRFGMLPASLLAVAASLPVVFFGPILAVNGFDAIFVAVALLAVGPGTAWALRRYSALTVAGGAALIVSAAFLLAPIGAGTLQGTLDIWKAAFQQAAASGSVSDPATLRTSAAAFVQLLSTAWPALVFYFVGTGVVISVPLVSRAGRSLGQSVNRYPALTDIDLSFHVVWPAIAGIALLAAGTFWGHGQGLVYAVGFNSLLILRPALVLQGLAVFAALYRRIGAGRVWRVIGFALLGLTELLLPSVSVLGLADLFFNLRRLPRTQRTLQGPVA